MSTEGLCFESTYTTAPRSGVKQHNISVKMQPGDVYLGHLACEDGHTGRQIAEQLKVFLTSWSIHLNNVLFVGVDGMAAMIGWING